MYWKKFCLNYIQIVVFLYFIVRVTFFFFFVSIIGCHNCSYSAILNSFVFLQIQLYDACTIELRIYGKLKLRMCSVNVATQTGVLPFKVRVVGSIPLPRTASFFLPFFSSTSFLTFLTLRIYPGVCASVGRVLRVYLAGLHRLRP